LKRILSVFILFVIIAGTARQTLPTQQSYRIENIPQKGLASGGSYMQLLGATWSYNWGVWSDTECRESFVPLIPSYYTYLDKSTWEKKIKARATCVHGGYWLVGNEPDQYGPSSDGGYQSDFDLLMASYNWAIGTIYKYDPEAKVIFGGFSGNDIEFANKMKAALQYKVAGWHFHLYDYPDIGHFRKSVSWFVGWSTGEAWLTEWGVLTGNRQVSWMQETLPIVLSSGLTRYSWYKTSENNANGIPLYLVDRQGQLTTLGQIYAGRYIPPTQTPAPSYMSVSVSEAEEMVQKGMLSVISGNQYSRCQAVGMRGGSLSVKLHGTWGEHKLYIYGYGKDWGSDSVFVAVNNSKEMTVDLHHSLSWVIVSNRGEWSGHTFRGSDFNIVIHTREPEAIIDMVSLDNIGVSHHCSSMAVSTPTLAATYVPPLTPTRYTLEERVNTLEIQVAELEAKQAQLWEIVTGGQ